MHIVRESAVPLKCPRCGSEQLYQPPQFVRGYDSARGYLPLMANPDPHVRCESCNARWHESDVDTAGARYAALRKAYLGGAK